MSSPFAVMLPLPVSHHNARCQRYPTVDGNQVEKICVPDDKVLWEVSFPEYNPVSYNAPRRHDECDADIGSVEFHFNALDNGINRKSSTKPYSLDDMGYPLNPIGRTGIKGRGRLPRWGPNHAADCLVTKWKRTSEGSVALHLSSGKPILQFISIRRRDSGVWAIPGGKVNPGESIDDTFLREFHEEALDGVNLQENHKVLSTMKAFFASGVTLYCGYVDDPRNTDNAWMETTVKNFHDETGETVDSLPLKAGDDADDLKWCDINHELKLFASHVDFIRKVAEIHGADW